MVLKSSSEAVCIGRELWSTGWCHYRLSNRATWCGKLPAVTIFWAGCFHVSCFLISCLRYRSLAASIHSTNLRKREPPRDFLWAFPFEHPPHPAATTATYRHHLQRGQWCLILWGLCGSHSSVLGQITICVSYLAVYQQLSKFPVFFYYFHLFCVYSMIVVFILVGFQEGAVGYVCVCSV